MGLISSEEAAERLSVKRATIYAYVSRGLLVPREVNGSNGSMFDPLDVENLANRGRKGRRSSQGSPMFVSAISTIHEGEFYYRGKSATRLALIKSYEEVAALLWEVDPARLTFRPDMEMVTTLRRQSRVLPTDLLPFERMKILIDLAAPMDPMRHDLNSASVIKRVSTLMATMIEAMPVIERQGGQEYKPSGEESFARRVWSRLCPEPPSDALIRALNAAMIVTADADVTTPTTIAARMAASVHTDIYSVLAAGMHCSGGKVQSASSLAVEGYLDGLNNEKSINQFIGERLREGQVLSGFGHQRFPDGDRRTRPVLDILTSSDSATPRSQKLAQFLAIQKQRGIAPPNIGFTIAALAYVAGMLRGSGDLIFALARMAGWTAHAMEQYQSKHEQNRPTSLYIGPPPESAE
ncbi:hypothetical protein EF888_12955 [Silicimonas algicola]|uniref:citrate synthase (unknown stereospecificity) n=1 Tax=Silicimonas algicola TaxID=1826607 RepID=A0A316G9P6_9RHOB|nr:citrate synthase [Silicimonas algicola]AZQ67961.1 hypothetical protein EF888_12955 [Silicimonas algicola]PWK57598.1 citrate synthase [Silicimonas algicola]